MQHESAAAAQALADFRQPASVLSEHHPTTLAWPSQATLASTAIGRGDTQALADTHQNLLSIHGRGHMQKSSDDDHKSGKTKQAREQAQSTEVHAPAKA